MSEDFLQYIWKQKLFEQKMYCADTGENVQIIHPGYQNTDAGPDFLNAQIRINETLWAGNVEVHLQASDWAKHRHKSDKAYENVVLHVVNTAGTPIQSNSGRTIPTIELAYDSHHENKYNELLVSNHWIPCNDKPGKVDRFLLTQWLTALAFERLEKRCVEIKALLAETQNNWETAFYIHLASSFGFKTNALPFEMLARSLPLQVLAKHKNNLFQVEALLLGQSGVLQQADNDTYTQKINDEYGFLQKKYGLNPLEGHIWKYFRLRPYNFPCIRIAQFASLIYHSSGLFSKIIHATHTDELLKLFDIKASDYWDTHFKPGQTAVKREKKMSADATYLILLNTVVPFLFEYGTYTGKAELTDKAVALLESLKAEKNAIIENWKAIGVDARNALESQALLQLKNAYCNPKKCLQCSIGNMIISNKEK